MQAALAEPLLTIAPERTDLAVLAKQHLARHPHFRGRLGGLRIENRGKTLILAGIVPTFYLKQLVQEAVRYLPGVHSVRNDIDVVNACGVSSVRFS